MIVHFRTGLSNSSDYSFLFKQFEVSIARDFLSVSSGREEKCWIDLGVGPDCPYVSSACFEKLILLTFLSLALSEGWGNIALVSIETSSKSWQSQYLSLMASVTELLPFLILAAVSQRQKKGEANIQRAPPCNTLSTHWFQFSAPHRTGPYHLPPFGIELFLAKD